MKQLVTIEQLPGALAPEIDLSVGTLRGLYQKRKIPYVKLGFRTLRFDPEKVRDAIYRSEVKTVA
jgi:hypothetical protein